MRQYHQHLNLYVPYGAAKEALYSAAPELLLSGPAGTGKSVLCLKKLHILAGRNYPRSRHLILRKTRKSLNQSTIVSFQNKVLPFGWLGNRVRFNTQLQEYQYWNGSIIALGGLDDPIKLMSSEWDTIFIEEAIEVEEEDWESATARLRNGMMPYQQLLAATNPSGSSHWLKKRADRKHTLMLDTRHEDNPRLFDLEKGERTKEGERYLSVLDRLSGARKERLRYGRWAQAEGAVYEDWNRAVHLVYPFDIPNDWDRYWCIDFGYNNPFTCQWWAQDPDGNLYLYRELYFTQRLVEDHAAQILAVSRYEPKPRAIVCDHDAEDRATLTRHLGYDTVAAYKGISVGVQCVQSRLRYSGNGKPRIFIFKDALIERDPRLDELKLPGCFEEEVEEYVWDTTNQRKMGEEPLKKNDHGCDAMRYMVAYFDAKDYSMSQVGDDFYDQYINYRGY